MMNLNILKIASDLLDLAADEFGNRICTDYTVDDTPDNREIIVDMDEDDDLIIEGGKICTDDFALMYYCADKLREFIEEEKKKRRKSNG